MMCWWNRLQAGWAHDRGRPPPVPVERHQAGCASCRAHQALLDRLHRAGPTPSATCPEGVRERVRTAVLQRVRQARHEAPVAARVNPVPRLIAVAAMLLLSALLVRGQGVAPPAAPPGQSPEIMALNRILADSLSPPLPIGQGRQMVEPVLQPLAARVQALDEQARVALREMVVPAVTQPEIHHDPAPEGPGLGTWYDVLRRVVG